MTVLKGMDKARAWREAHPNPRLEDPCVLAIGALPRSGKSFMGAATAHLYSQLLQAHGSNRGARVLVYTTQPTETGSTWTKVFSQHAEFDTSAAAAGATTTMPLAGAPAAAAGAAGQGGAGPSNAVATGPAVAPISWVVMSKQSYDCSKAGRKKKKPKSAATRRFRPPVKPA